MSTETIEDQQAQVDAWNRGNPADVLVDYWLGEKTGAATGSGRTYGPAALVDGIGMVFPVGAHGLVALSHVEVAAVRPPIIRCCHCNRWTRLTRSDARNSGWRFYDGRTQGGVELHDVICNVCTGEVTPLVTASDDEGAQIIAEGSIPNLADVMYMTAALNGDVPGVRVVSAAGEVL